MEDDVRKKLIEAQTKSGDTYSGGNLNILVSVPLENLYFSYLTESVFRPKFKRTFLAYVLKVGDDFSHAIHFPVDFNLSFHSITNTALLVNPDASLFMLKKGNENVPDDQKRFEHFKQDAMANFDTMTKIVDGKPQGITADLLSGKSHTRDFRFSLPQFTIDYILSR